MAATYDHQRAALLLQTFDRLLDLARQRRPVDLAEQLRLTDGDLLAIDLRGDSTAGDTSHISRFENHRIRLQSCLTIANDRRGQGVVARSLYGDGD